jgi:translation initiation factor 2A
LIECPLGECDDDESNREETGRRPFLEGDSRHVQLAKCSPRGSHLLTWERPGSSSAVAGGGGEDANDGGGGGNLKAWDAATGKLFRGFHSKKATLNSLQWTHDEAFAFHLVTNEVHVYAGNDLRKRVGRIRCQSLSFFSLPSVKGSPPNIISNKDGEGRYLLIVFVPGVKGKPARVDLLRYPDRLGRESSTIPKTGGDVHVNSGPSLASKSLYDAEEASVKWSPRADAALVQTHTTIDATGESYYGSSHLFLFSEDDVKKSGNGNAIAVTLPNESTKTSGGGSIPIVSASWMPNPQITGPMPFGVISGTMPSLSSLHHGITGEPTYLLGMAHRNTMDASPHGRFVITGGYGNLAGGMDFWDRNKGKRIHRRVILPHTDDPASYVTMKEDMDLVVTSPRPVVGHQWAPDSRTYMVSTTSPRMNVDNGVSVYRYDGSLVDDSMLPWDNSRYCPDKLLCAEFVPAPFPSSDVGEKRCGGGTGSGEFYYYPDRPQSPPPRGMVEVKGDAADVALAKLMATRNGSRSGANATGGGNNNGKGGVPPTAAYVPPAARKLGSGGAGGGGYVPPGARNSVGGGGSLAERMRREREGSAANVSGVKVVKRTGPVGASSVVPASAAASEKSKSAMRREKQVLAREKAEREALEAERQRAEEERTRIEANKADPEKRVKKIYKMLKQIDEIKSKKANGAELNDDQRKKMEVEEELRRELASLQL